MQPTSQVQCAECIASAAWCAGTVLPMLLWCSALRPQRQNLLQSQIMSDIKRACWCGQVGFTCFSWSGRSSLAAVLKCSSGAGHRVKSSLHFKHPCSRSLRVTQSIFNVHACAEAGQC